MKRSMGIIAATVIFAATLPAYAAETKINVNGKDVIFTDAKPYIDENNRTMVPLRPIAEAMGLEVGWNDAKKTASFTKNITGSNAKNWRGEEKAYLTFCGVDFEIGKNYYTVTLKTTSGDGGKTEKETFAEKTDTAAVIKDSRTYAPFRYLAEEFGYNVEWDADTATVFISGDITGIKTRNDEMYMKKAIHCFSSCVEEIFNADVDYNAGKMALYKDEESFEKGEILKLYSSDEKIDENKYFTDPTVSLYYPVKNFKTNAEVREEMRKYMSDEIIDKWFRNDFTEYGGELYMRRGGRGYGALICDESSAKFIGEENGKRYVEVTFMLFDEYDHTEVLGFSNINGRWILTEENTKE